MLTGHPAMAAGDTGSHMRPEHLVGPARPGIIVLSADQPTVQVRDQVRRLKQPTRLRGCEVDGVHETGQIVAHAAADGILLVVAEMPSMIVRPVDLVCDHQGQLVPRLHVLADLFQQLPQNHLVR
ncbi:hypothetical protein SGR_1608 [Streptomyces griseus subsp. griseus NBRC 13350]|uniref:Uncharacterized protein n=1 Tax=Streptomyces griseus subsp. griseus (strain JCM 4626 / CBS 651.72 / NBRC 13350 / KCC S-0626 / ISP 5235) TaxID=455632 RepID=B1VXH1_STRGG|nr:hypothetical protein SGR_1608 [Streptomyces griseus subsp. griseus NBRC 13350]